MIKCLPWASFPHCLLFDFLELWIWDCNSLGMDGYASCVCEPYPLLNKIIFISKIISSLGRSPVLYHYIMKGVFEIVIWKNCVNWFVSLFIVLRPLRRFFFYFYLQTMEDAVHFLSKETVVQAIARSATKVCSILLQAGFWTLTLDF